MAFRRGQGHGSGNGKGEQGREAASDRCITRQLPTWATGLAKQSRDTMGLPPRFTVLNIKMSSGPIE